MNAIDQIILQEQSQARDPEFTVLQVHEVLSCQAQRPKTHRALIDRSNLRGHPPVYTDDRSIDQRIDGEQLSSWFDDAMDLLEEPLPVRHMMQRIGGVDA